MIPRQQSAGISGMISGIGLAIALLLYITSGATPETFADPAKALPLVSQNVARLRTVAVLLAIHAAFAIIFIAGFAGKLREKTPTRATGVLYFGVLGLVGSGLEALVFGSAWPAVAAYAGKDQVAAAHAWVAINALSGTLRGFAGLFVGLSTLLAGWAIVTGGAMTAGLGWYGVVTAVVLVLREILPEVPVLFPASLLLLVIWLLWAGNTLRTGT